MTFYAENNNRIGGLKTDNFWYKVGTCLHNPIGPSELATLMFKTDQLVVEINQLFWGESAID
jgi:hypothetical protein